MGRLRSRRGNVALALCSSTSYQGYKGIVACLMVQENCPAPIAWPRAQPYAFGHLLASETAAWTLPFQTAAHH